MPTDPLSNLRDIHLPDTPSWWPLALGWWLLIALIILVVIFLIKINNKKKLKSEPLIFSITEYKNDFSEIEKKYQENKDTLALVQSTSMLLRKISIKKNKFTTSLTGRKWLDNLDLTFKTNLFSQQYSDAFLYANYSSNTSIEPIEFITFIKTCLDSLDKETSKKNA